MNDIFNTEWYKRFNHGSMNEFLALSQRFKRFGLTYEDVYDAIKSACDFFRIPMPLGSELPRRVVSPMLTFGKVAK